ncbi:MAG: tRNA preQ1(34) S-adenosylmethionine ribosyltransferase-isomerase QueA [Bacilli bacterium]|nr:tRNA preQ1(34) S-adenosylmethionine ribosyltransferase-isomerase QueA [Bacilli bacterium]MDD3841170.1 tRNA preQ1(34) S-adenosylmethionine ribosyltransferase-isomerase QueA [Bacilli bacterium]HKM10146.1 tRNA preQ1(34) S-adenosylmethionine ribosyltransferase-isomerase QueA [Bacilli bacterium]
MDINLFDFPLPEDLIAQKPADKRDHSRLLAVNYGEKTLKDEHFYEIIKYFHKGDVLVRNNTKVIPARLLGIKEKTGAHCELLLLKQIINDDWECLCRPAKSLKIGSRVIFGDGELIAECIEEKNEGLRVFRFIYQGIFLEVLDKLGKMPLPPYIKKQITTNDRYQTVYAKLEGSAAAPTAGFHFTDDIFEELKKIGVQIVDITLHIGLGTFRPVQVTDTKDHLMHSELYEISESSSVILNAAKESKKRIIAVGTTTVRTLEANYSKYGIFKPTRESTNIFIQPGYKFKVVDALVTNFHLPKSTLLMLVSAFMDRDFALLAYQHAVDKKYRFFSFGDAMFIYGK